MSNTLYTRTSWTTQHALSSDHLPIITTINIRHDYILQQNQRTYTNYKKADWTQFTEDRVRCRSDHHTHQYTHCQHNFLKHHTAGRQARVPPAGGETAQRKIFHLVNWSQLIHPGPSSSRSIFFMESSQLYAAKLTHYSTELLTTGPDYDPLLLLLALAGDVHPNPGPSRSPARSASKRN